MIRVIPLHRPHVCKKKRTKNKIFKKKKRKIKIVKEFRMVTSRASQVNLFTCKWETKSFVNKKQLIAKQIASDINQHFSFLR